MDIVNDWNKIKKHFNKSFYSNFHVAIASVNKDNKPTVTPIGSLFLNNWWALGCIYATPPEVRFIL